MSVDIFLIGSGGQLGWEVERQIPSTLSVQALARAQFDITNREQVLRGIAGAAPKVVVNAAAYTAVDQAETERSEAFLINRDGPAYLAEACNLHGATLIHVSTDYVFDGAKAEPYTEDDATTPLSVYGESKLAGELAVRAGCPRHVIFRTAWVYGVQGKNFVKTMLRLGGLHDQLRIVNDQHGSPTFARDLAKAVIFVAERMTNNVVPSNGFGTFHCAGGGVTTWHRFARRIFDICKSKGMPVPEIEGVTTAQYPTPAPRPPNSVLDCNKVARVYGIAMRSWEEALAEMLNETLGADVSAGDA